MGKTRLETSYDKLPEAVKKTTLCVNGNYGWRMADFEAAVDGAAQVGVALDCGEVQFHLDGSIFDLYWLNVDGFRWLYGESWSKFVSLNAAEIKRQFRYVCATTDFVAEAKAWNELKYKIDQEGLDPLQILIFSAVLYSEDGMYEHNPFESRISTVSFQQIVEEIMATHHSLLKRELPRISQQLEALSAAHAGNETVAEAKQIFAKVRNKVETHLKDEETTLFPDGIALERGGTTVTEGSYVLERLDEMEKEHDGCGKTLTMIQNMLDSTLPPSPERDGVIANIQLIQDDFVAHVEKENNKVHPMLREMIGTIVK